jgi:hypothetical protein
MKEFSTPRLHPVDPAQKAKDRLVVEIFGKMMGPFYKAFMAKTPEERVNSYKVKNGDVLFLTL